MVYEIPLFLAGPLNAICNFETPSSNDALKGFLQSLVIWGYQKHHKKLALFHGMPTLHQDV